jgi:hypothetical protein
MNTHALTRTASAALLLLGAACADPSTPFQPTGFDTPSLSSVIASGPGGVRPGLALWLRADAGIGVTDGAQVVQWRDQSGHGRDAIWNAANTYGELAPVFRASNAPLQSRPSVRFDGQQALDLDLGFVVGSNYTVIAVNGRDRAGDANFWLAGDRRGFSESLILGYERPDLLRLSHFGNDLDAVVENYTGTQLWSLDTYTFDQQAGRAIYHNGVPSATDNSLAVLTSASGANLGHFRTLPIYWFQGDLAEVIMFDRVLSSTERLRVETQLAQRYGFALQLEFYAPCAGPWASHEEYVAAQRIVVRDFVDARLLTRAEGKAARAAAEASSCGSEGGRRLTSVVRRRRATADERRARG